MKKNKSLWIILGILVILAVSAIVLFSNSSGNKNSSQSGSSSTTYNVEIRGMQFIPTPITIKAGDTVIWTNHDQMDHTVTSDNGTELQSGNIGTNQTYSHTFDTPGIYYYHCSIHKYMMGTIVVQ